MPVKMSDPITPHNQEDSTIDIRMRKESIEGWHAEHFHHCLQIYLPFANEKQALGLAAHGDDATFEERIISP